MPGRISCDQDVSCPESGVAANDSDEWDDPQDTLIIPEADSNEAIPTDSPKDETDSDHQDFFDGKQHYICEEDYFLQECDASLYMLQSQAPIPKCVCSNKKIENCPPHYGQEYHGFLDRAETISLLGAQDGSYLVRENLDGVKVLSFMMEGRMYNYKLFFDEGMHYVGDNHFESVEELVQDGLITLYLQHHNVVQTMQKGRMSSMAHRKKTEKFKRVQNKRRKKSKEVEEYRRTVSDSSLTSIRSPSRTPSPSLSPPPSPILGRRRILADSGGEVEVQPRRILADSEEQPDSQEIESNLDTRSRSGFRRSTPYLGSISPPPRNMHFERRTSSIPSFPVVHSPSPKTSNRYSAIISTLRDAVNEDKRKEMLKLDSSVSLKIKTSNSDGLKIKTSNSDGRIVKSSGSYSDCKNGSSHRSSSGNEPFATSLERLADLSIKGTNSFSRASMAALAKHTSGPRSPYFKAHNFSVHSYIGPTWCEICHHFLWGLKHQGMRCKDCGMDVHRQCLPLATQLECYPNKQFVKRVYGVDLTTLVKLEGGVIPHILKECIDHIQSRGLSVEGLYRISGQTSEILQLKEKYDAGEEIYLSRYLDINIVTGAIKLYFRKLPIPLVTFDAYSSIMKATAGIENPEDPDADWQSFSSALKLLPKAHYATLKHLAEHLYRVHLESAENKMTAQNLSVVFAPTLMRSPSESTPLIKDMPIQRNFVEYTILKNDKVFR